MAEALSALRLAKNNESVIAGSGQDGPSAEPT